MENGVLQAGLSALQLPESIEKSKDETRAAIKRAYAILPFLLPAYESPSSVGACDSLVRTIDQILPPPVQMGRSETVRVSSASGGGARRFR